jgi:hypothetical protein
LIVYIGLVFSALSLVIGILIGLSSLALSSGYEASSSLADDILFHPDIMIFGVIGGLLITEKLESMEKFKFLNTFKISRPIIFFLFSGTVIVSTGYLMNNPVLVDIGLIFVIISSILFLHFLTSKMGHSVAGIRWMFGASVAAIALTAIANMSSTIWMNIQLTYLALLFPIIYIVAERVELGFIRGMGRKVIGLQAALSWIIVLTAFASVEYPQYFGRSLIMGSSIIILLLMILTALRFDPSFHSSPRRGKFQTYLRTGVIVAYSWLFIGIALFAFQLTTSEDILDAATHSIALGFIGTFIIAHSPIIFPMTLKKNAVQDRVTFSPILIITIATTMRVYGDLGFGSGYILNFVSYLSGYVLIIAILAFVFNLRRIISPSPAPTPAY